MKLNTFPELWNSFYKPMKNNSVFSDFISYNSKDKESISFRYRRKFHNAGKCFSSFLTFEIDTTSIESARIFPTFRKLFY